MKLVLAIILSTAPVHNPPPHHHHHKVTPICFTIERTTVCTVFDPTFPTDHDPV